MDEEMQAEQEFKAAQRAYSAAWMTAADEATLEKLMAAVYAAKDRFLAACARYDADEEQAEWYAARQHRELALDDA